MKIHLNRAGQGLGQFTPHEVRAGYSDGRFQGTDLAWHEGMPSWKPLAEVIDEIAPAEAGDQVTAEAAAQEGPAWEHRGELGFLKALLETVRDVLIEPTATFSRMKQRGGFGSPLVFLLILSMVGAVVQEAYNMAFRHFGGTLLQGDQANALMAQMRTPLDSLQTIVLMPIFIVIGAFLVAGIVHLCLMLVGGANRPYEATFRVLAYANGAGALFSLVPGCGALIAFVWVLVVEIIGLSEVQQIGKGRAALAILLPMIVCCGLIIAALAAGGAAMWPMIMEAVEAAKNQ